MIIDLSGIVKKSVTVGQAATILGVHTRTLRDHCRKGLLKHFKLPGPASRIRIDVAELRRYAKASGITIARDTYLTTVTGLEQVLIVSPAPAGFADALARVNREVAVVTSPLAAGVVMARRWFDLVVLDGRGGNFGFGLADCVAYAVTIRAIGGLEVKLCLVDDRPRPESISPFDAVCKFDNLNTLVKP